MVLSETVYSTETYFAVFTDLDVFLFSSSHTELITRYNRLPVSAWTSHQKV